MSKNGLASILLSVAFLLGGGLLACGSSTPGLDGGPCLADGSCKDGLSCVDGRCETAR